ncbi:MAG TPA: hypothetical protein VHE30_09860 [Polyangiaceae bacterium]|nr:hypothetical protein [Polyangiaceae bacterium]
MELPHEWREFIDLLLSHRVRFVVVGAHALAALGRPRATQDIDLLVEPTEANARRLCDALKAFGFTALAREQVAFTEPDRMATLGQPPLRIDVMTSISGVTFEEAWAGRVKTRVGGRTIGFLGRAEFVKNKRASGRTKDLLDIALLEESAPPRRARAKKAPRKRGRKRAR